MDINKLKETKQKMEADIDESQSLLNQQNIVLEKEETRCQSEIEKLVSVVSILYQ